MNFCSFFCCQEDKPNEEANSEIQIDVKDSLPMVVKDSGYSELCQDSEKAKLPYTDTAFPPNDLALGSFLHINRKLHWKRITEIVKDPCIYSLDKNPADSIISVTSSGSHMKAALLALAFKPERIHNIFGGVSQANPLGIYRLKVKVKGIVEWLYIDDYIPVFTDTQRPLLCGTVGHQIWMMLIFKAYAKISGSYSQIQSQDCFNVLNTFSPGPCFSYLLDPSLNDDKDTSSQIADCLSSPWNTICVSTGKDAKLGLRTDYNYSVRSFKNGVTELVGLGLDHQLSHELTFPDLFSNCVQMAVSTHDPRCVNSQQKNLQIKYNTPFFLQFQLEEPYSLTFNLWKAEHEEETFIRVVVGRVQSQGFSYVASKLEAYYEDMAVQCPEMKPGIYKILIMVNAPKMKIPSLQVNFVCYKKLYGQLSIIQFKQSQLSSLEYIQFMKDVFGDLTRGTTGRITRQFPSSGSVLQIFELFRKGGLGYVSIVAGSKKGHKHLKVKIDHNSIRQSFYELLEIFPGDLSVLPHTSINFIFLLKCLPSKEHSKIEFPPGISIVEIF